MPSKMRLISTMVAFVMVSCLGGCIYPIGSKTTSGYKYSAEAIAFLDLPGTTRAEVVSSLGPPLIDSQTARTLLYVWEQTPKYIAVSPDNIAGIPMNPEPHELSGNSKQWGLFVGYDERGIVKCHEIRKLRAGSLEDACLVWAQLRMNLGGDRPDK